MGHLNLPASKQNLRQRKLLDIISAYSSASYSFILLVFTPLGDSSAASGTQALLLSTSDSRQRHRLVALVELGHHHRPIEACPADSVDHMPCEDPRRNSQLSMMKMPLCLIPPLGYKIPVLWPESLRKIWHSNMPHNKIADSKGRRGWMKGARCEPFSTYPRAYDLIHAAGIESLIKLPGSSKSRCNLVDLMVEIDRMLRLEGTVVIRDSPEVIDKVAHIAHAVRWTCTISDMQ